MWCRLQALYRSVLHRRSSGPVETVVDFNCRTGFTAESEAGLSVMRKVPTASTGGETFSFEYIYLFALTSAIVCPVFSPNEDIRWACSYYREQRWLNWKRKINACNQPRPLRSRLGVHRGCRKRDSRRTGMYPLPTQQNEFKVNFNECSEYPARDRFQW